MQNPEPSACEFSSSCEQSKISLLNGNVVMDFLFLKFEFILTLIMIKEGEKNKSLIIQFQFL